MQKQEISLTKEGFLELEEELNYLKLNKRPEVIKSLKEARALGDLSENADYSAAREEQSQVEGRIRELEYKLGHASIIDDVAKKGIVSVGTTATVEYMEDEAIEEYRIVGSLEVDPFNNKISNESPIGKAIIGKKVGEIVEVASPKGSYQVRIVKVA